MADMSRQEMHEAARRLALPGPQRMSVSEAEEIRTCTGCTARYERKVRVVRTVPGCPVHAVAQAAA